MRSFGIFTLLEYSIQEWKNIKDIDSLMEMKFLLCNLMEYVLMDAIFFDATIAYIDVWELQ